MKKYLIKINQYAILILLLCLALIFVHSELSGIHDEEAKEFHAQYDFCSLVSKTLLSKQDNLLQFAAEDFFSVLTKCFYGYEILNCSVDFLAAFYPRDVSLILLFSTLLI